MAKRKRTKTPTRPVTGSKTVEVRVPGRKKKGAAKLTTRQVKSKTEFARRRI